MIKNIEKSVVESVVKSTIKEDSKYPFFHELLANSYRENLTDKLNAYAKEYNFDVVGVTTEGTVTHAYLKVKSAK